MIEGWQEKILGDLVQLQRGHDLPESRREDGDVPVMGSFGVTGSHSTAKAQGPGVTVGRSGGSIGVVSFTAEDYWPLNTCLYVTDFLGNNERFAYYFLQTLNLSAYNSGSAQPSLNRNHIHPLKIQFPKLPEQEAIAEVLSSLDSKMELLQRQNATLEALAETLFRQAFIEEAQEDWEDAIVADYAVHKKDGVKPQDHPETVFWHYSLPAFDEGRVPTQELGQEIRSGKYRVPDRSVLISKLNPEVSRVWLIGDQRHEANICSTEFQVALPKKAIYLPFLYCLFKSREMRNELAAAAGGTSKSHQRVKPDDIFDYAFPMPPDELVEAFAEEAMPCFEQVFENQKQIQTLEKLRDTLLPKLMSGEVRVALDQEAV